MLLILLACAPETQDQPGIARICADMTACSGAEQFPCAVVACGDELSGECTAQPTHHALVATDLGEVIRAQGRCERAGGTWMESPAEQCPEQETMDGAKIQLEVACIYP